jgi:hypothetical protein
MSDMTKKALLAAVGLTMLASGAVAGVVDPSQSTVDPVIVGNSSGNAIGGGFVVKPRGSDGFPDDPWIVEIRFLGSGGRPYSTQLDGSDVDCGAMTISRVVDSSGDAVFYPRISGYENSREITVIAGGIFLTKIMARSTDLDGSGSTDLADLSHFRSNFFSNPAAPETDYDENGSTGLEDFETFRKEFFSGVSGTPCQ